MILICSFNNNVMITAGIYLKLRFNSSLGWSHYIEFLWKQKRSAPRNTFFMYFFHRHFSGTENNRSSSAIPSVLMDLRSRFLFICSFFRFVWLNWKREQTSAVEKRGIPPWIVVGEWKQVATTEQKNSNTNKMWEV